MSYQHPPRYLQVAHWLHAEQRPIGSREAADAFNMPVKAISDDFAKIRGRPDLIEVHEQKVRRNGVQQYLLHVLTIYPYALDGRQYPFRQESASHAPDTALTWYDLLSRPWHHLALMHPPHDAD